MLAALEELSCCKSFIPNLLCVLIPPLIVGSQLDLRFVQTSVGKATYRSQVCSKAKDESCSRQSLSTGSVNTIHSENNLQ